MDIKRFITCDKPKSVYNRALRSFVTVACGRCPSCLSKKTNYFVSRINDFLHDSSYALFFTLTYNNDTLPLMYLELGSGALVGSYVSGWSFSRSPRDRKKYSDYSISFSRSTEVVASADEIQGKDLTLLSKPYRDALGRIVSQNSIPYVRQKDCVNFIKRFRRLSNIDCAFFAAGEYGPQSFRPHFHGLLFVRDYQDIQYLQYLLRKSWRFGNVDSSLVQSSAPSYVAKYVSGCSLLPSPLNLGLAKPRHYCSCFASYSSTVKQDLQEVYNTRSNLRVIQSPQGPLVSTLQKSFATRYLSRLSDSDRISFDEYLRRCNLLSASFIQVPYNFGYMQIEPCGVLPSDLCSLSRTLNDDGSTVIPSRFYRDYLVVKHYHDACCILNVSFYSYVKFIYEYHYGFPSEDDKVSNQIRALRCQYEAQEVDVSHEDTFVSLCQYHEFFYHFSHYTNYHDLPSFLQYQITHQNLTWLYNSRGVLLFNYLNTSFYANQSATIHQHFVDGLKTKYINDL